MLIIVETDEFRHISYKLDHEWSKLLKHCQSAIQTDGIKQVLFIRFNPDQLDTRQPLNEDALQERFSVLKTLIEDRVENSTNLLEVYQMFYEPNIDVKRIEDEEVELWIDYLRE